MEITLNGKKREVPEGIDLQQLLDQFGLPRQRIAIEQNARVIRRGDWAKTTVSESDKIEVIHFVGGG